MVQLIMILVMVTIMLTLLPTKGLISLEFILQFMQEEEVVLEEFILDPASGVSELTVELKKF